MASVVRIVERYKEAMPAEEFNQLFEQVMSAIPLTGDLSENETMLKFVINVNTSEPGRVAAHMDKVALLCCKIIADSEC